MKLRMDYQLRMPALMDFCQELKINRSALILLFISYATSADESDYPTIWEVSKDKEKLNYKTGLSIRVFR